MNMLTGNDMRQYINSYIYAFNKYNIFGGIMALFFATMTGLLTLNNNTFDIPKTFVAILILVMSLIIIKLAIKKSCSIEESCDCSNNIFKYPYRHSNFRKCPKDRDINELLYNTKYEIITHIVNFVYKYNIFGGILALIISSLLKVISAKKTFFDLTNIMVITLIFAGSKTFIDYFLKIQGYCPCDCKNDPSSCTPDSNNIFVKKTKAPKKKKNFSRFKPYTLEDVRNEIENEVDKILQKRKEEEEKHKADEEKNTTKDPLQKKLEVEEGFKNSYKRPTLKSKMNKVQKKICSYNKKNNTSQSKNINECIRRIKKDKDLKDFLRSLLESKKDYQCLVDSNSSTQLESCLIDFLSKNPEMALQMSSIVKA